MDLSMAGAVVLAERPDVWLAKTVEVDPGFTEAVIPPQADGIPFHNFQKTLQDGLLAGTAGGVAVRVGPAEIMIRRERVREIAIGRREVFVSFLRQLPNGCPLDLPLFIKRLRNPVIF